jgi:hypothetical protein
MASLIRLRDARAAALLFVAVSAGSALYLRQREQMTASAAYDRFSPPHAAADGASMPLTMAPTYLGCVCLEACSDHGEPFNWCVTDRSWCGRFSLRHLKRWDYCTPPRVDDQREYAMKLLHMAAAPSVFVYDVVFGCAQSSAQCILNAVFVIMR